MKRRTSKRQSALAVFVALSMVFAFMCAPGFAGAKSAQGSSGTPEWAVDTGEDSQSDALSAQAEPPSTYDLRTEGLVTPVKLQNPWGSCWAFGGTAAAETSLLSAYGSTYKSSKLDLSERHLTYFALQPVSESVDSTQVGEGLHTVSPDANAAFDAGGFPIYITTLFSQGVGPELESLFPYRGNTGLTSLEYFNAHPEDATKAELKKAGFTDDQITDALIEQYKPIVKNAYTNSPTYSNQDDWSIPEKNEDGTSNRLLSCGVVLNDGNVLPTYRNADGTLNSESSKAIKQELLNGHGVSIMYHAEQGTRYAKKPNEANKDQNQYVFEAASQNHSVCVVGWDDNYSADNFYHEVTKTNPDGTTEVDTDATEKTTPPGNGAWIVKNSWGSETDATEESADDLGNIMNKGTWGTLNSEGKATGYFYLSYYDQSVKQPETMNFSADLGENSGFYVLQNDYMPASGGFYTTAPTSDVTSSANVFSADDTDLNIKSVSTQTSEVNTRVTFAIYELNDNAKDPTDGTLVYRTSRNFEYGGFHRISLDRPVTIAAGKKFSVVSTASTLGTNGTRTYSVSASRGLTKKTVDYLREKGNTSVKVYSTAVVNKGESFIYDGKTWTDWSDYTSGLAANAETAELMPSDKYTDVCAIDNFSIKVYAEPSTANNDTMHRLYNPNSGEHFYTASNAECTNLVSLGWNDEGIGWTAPGKSDTPVYRLYNEIGGEHHYTMDASERDMLVAAGWNDEGIGWYSDDAQGQVLYREYNPNAFSCNHNYTTDKGEHDYLVSIGWNDEGTAWYGLL